MSSRSYQQFCGVAKALDVVGERWTLLIVRELLLRPRRYTELLSLLEGLTTNLLAKRLQEMQAVGLLEKREGAYALTEEGRALEPVVMALGAWGFRRMKKGPSRGEALNIGWAMLSLKRRFQGARRGCVIELRSDERRFQYALSPGGVALEEGGERLADLTISGSSDALRLWFFGGGFVSVLEPLGALEIAGDREALAVFVEAFSLQ